MTSTRFQDESKPYSEVIIALHTTPKEKARHHLVQNAGGLVGRDEHCLGRSPEDGKG